MQPQAESTPPPREPDPCLRREAAPALGYAAAYIGYLFVHQEGEFLHWATLVLLPLALTVVHRRRARSEGLAGALASVGLRRGNLWGGMWWGVALGLGFCALQFAGSRSRDQIVPLVTSARGLALLPLAFALMACTAAGTEEFFFRGVVQTRLRALCRSHVAAIAVTTLLFSVYHLPYAYLNERWPSHGDWGQALAQAFGQAVPTGLALGAVYAAGRSNLLACVVLHALINTLPALVLVDRMLAQAA